jgi:hypothetical protein
VRRPPWRVFRLWHPRSSCPIAGAQMAASRATRVRWRPHTATAQHPISGLRDMTADVTLSRLTSSWHKSSISPDIFAPCEAPGIFDCGGVCQRSDWPNTRNAHQSSADRIGRGPLDEQAIGGMQLLLNRFHGRNERSEQRGEIRTLSVEGCQALSPPP